MEERSPFKKGSTVEVSSLEDGLRNAWFPATVLQPPSLPTKKKTNRRSNSKMTVQYKHILAQDGTFLVEQVHTFLVRPNPPSLPDTKNPFHLNDVVDAFHDEIWWTGVVVDVRNDDDYIVRFIFPPDVLFCKRSQLRPHWDWAGRKWLRPQKQELKYLKFRSGTAVEVNLDPDKIIPAWMPAIVIGEIDGTTTVGVKCKRNIKDDCEQVVVVEGDMIRSQPPEFIDVFDKDFEVGDKVDALCDMGWSVGVVTHQFLLPRKYIVKFAHGMKTKEKMFDHNELRYHFDWGAENWVGKSEEKLLSTPVSKKRKILNGSRGYATRKRTSCSTAAKAKVSRTQKNDNNIAKSNQAEETEPQGVSVFENTGSVASLQDGDQNNTNIQHLSPDNDVAKLNHIEELDNSGRLAERQESPPASRSTSLEAPASENTCGLACSFKEGDQNHMNMKVQSPNNDIAKPNQIEELDDSGKLAETQEAPVFENTGSAASIQEAANDDVAKSNQIEELDDSGRLAETQEALVFENTNSAASFQEAANDDVAKSNRIEELDDSGRLVETQGAPVFENTSSAASFQERDQNDNIGAICEIHRNGEHHDGNNVQQSSQNLPMEKRSAIWEFVDSLEVFKKLPQNPQVQFMAAANDVELQVIALTSKVKFAYVIDMISKLNEETTTTETVDSLIKQLNKLQNMGFDVELLKNYLSEFKRLKLELKDVKTQLMEYIGY
ncbi:hypothetical protein G4B88_002114 [Cannabis sativa]|uniref:Agenet domain-containing protein n=1 Tax=Cannabis sativa TaxID=3483 RepID=A0A7J6EY58_CANSA|nr:hypothetical protein G4B88_002114 [Cannabis sativa]